MSGRARLGLATAYAAVTFLAFPHPLGARVIDLGLVLAWASPALLLLVVAGLPPGSAARWGFGASLAAHSAVLHWIYVVTVVYGHAPAAVGVLAPVLLASYVAAFGAAFGAGIAWLAARGLAGPFAAAALWTSLDHLRSFALSGFPWATLGYAQHLNVALLPLAAWTGVYGLSFVTALGGAALAELVLCARARRRPGARALAALGVVAAAHLAGLAAPDPEAIPGRESIRVAVLQGNIDQGIKWSRAAVDRTLAIYEDLTRRAVAEGARVVVWPETAVPGLLDLDPDLRTRLRVLARETRAYLVVGSVGVDRDGGRGTRYYDSAFTIDSRGEFRDRYDKTHLVPFGEYIPFQDLLGHFLKAVARGIAETGVTPGDAPRALVLDGPVGGGVRVGVPVCYELLFPNLVRRFAADGAEMLLAITNDAWYGRTGAPYQFLAITALRSAETRLWTARAANTGVSAFIDGRGRVRESTPIFERAWLVADVPRRPRPRESSFYVRHGDVFAAGCWASVAALAGAGWWRGRRVREGAE